MEKTSQSREPRTFVLMHGAWHGGWCWERVAGILRARGHHVTTPTQTGLGERAHLISDQITLGTFIDDLVNHLIYEDLSDVTLVGHSFGGNAVSGAAERVPERIRDIVYLDSTILGAGESLLEQLPESKMRARIAKFDASDGISIAPPPPEIFGVTDPEDADWLAARLTPHPISSMRSQLPISGPPGAGLPARYIACSEPRYHPADRVRGWTAPRGWQVEELATGHDAMVTAPGALAERIER